MHIMCNEDKKKNVLMIWWSSPKTNNKYNKGEESRQLKIKFQKAYGLTWKLYLKIGRHTHGCKHTHRESP